MASELVKRCSTPLVIRKMQVRQWQVSPLLERDHCTPTRMARMKKADKVRPRVRSGRRACTRVTEMQSGTATLESVLASNLTSVVIQSIVHLKTTPKRQSYDSSSVTSWKRRNYGGGKRLRGCQRSEGQGRTGGAWRSCRAVKLLCVVLSQGYMSLHTCPDAQTVQHQEWTVDCG